MLELKNCIINMREKNGQNFIERKFYYGFFTGDEWCELVKNWGEIRVFIWKRKKTTVLELGRNSTIVSLSIILRGSNLDVKI